MDLFIIGVVVLVAIAYGIFYYWSKRNTSQSTNIPYKIETPVLYTMDETFGMPIQYEKGEKSVKKPAKMAKPKLTKVEGGTSTKTKVKGGTSTKTKVEDSTSTKKPKVTPKAKPSTVTKSKKPKSTPKK